MRTLIVVSGMAFVMAATAQGQVQTQPATPQQNQAQPEKQLQVPQLNDPQNAFPPPLYRMNDVAQSLNMTPAQINQLNEMTTQTQGRFADQLGKIQNLPADQRAAQIQMLNQQYAGMWNTSASGIFNQQQWNRYQQLQLQYGGFNSLMQPELQAKLNLSDPQRTALRQNADWSVQQMAEIQKLAATDQARAMESYRDYQKSFQNRFNAFLSAEQQKAWQDLTGQPYSFQPGFAPQQPQPKR